MNMYELKSQWVVRYSPSKDSFSVEKFFSVLLSNRTKTINKESSDFQTFGIYGKITEAQAAVDEMKELQK